VIVGVSFAEIFFGNTIKLGIPCLTASREEIECLAARIEVDPKLSISLNIPDGRVSFGDSSFLGTLPAGSKNSLLNGRWDPIAELLEGEEIVEQVASTLAYVGGSGA
jgi:3-isopropylmalate/(R)-2-methylmalate dehydratase small subunit